jgi:hypothetical protein
VDQALPWKAWWLGRLSSPLHHKSNLMIWGEGRPSQGTVTWGISEPARETKKP